MGVAAQRPGRTMWCHCTTTPRRKPQTSVAAPRNKTVTCTVHRFSVQHDTYGAVQHIANLQLLQHMAQPTHKSSACRNLLSCTPASMPVIYPVPCVHTVPAAAPVLLVQPGQRTMHTQREAPQQHRQPSREAGHDRNTLPVTPSNTQRATCAAPPPVADCLAPLSLPATASSAV